MPKPIHPSLAESFPQPQGAQPAPSDVFRALGGIGLPGEKGEPDRMGRSGKETSHLSWELVGEVYLRTTELFQATGTRASLDLPPLEESETIHWDRLREGYEAYERLGLEPELVISPAGQPLSFWEEFYGGLRQWQDANRPDPQHKLQSRTDGDGLYVNEQVRRHWNELVDTSDPHWTASVIPTVVKAPALKVDHAGKLADGTVPPELQRIFDAVPTTRPGHHNPTPESYLMLQASRLYRDEQPPDDKVGSLYYYSWLDGTFTNDDGNKAAPYGGFRSVFGQVFLLWSEVDFRIAFLGARPEVRGSAT